MKLTSQFTKEEVWANFCEHKQASLESGGETEENECNAKGKGQRLLRPEADLKGIERAQHKTPRAQTHSIHLST